MKTKYWMCKVCYRRMPNRFDNCYSCGKPRKEVDDLLYQTALEKNITDEKTRQKHLKKINESL